jgi:hypothetical protein
MQAKEPKNPNWFGELLAVLSDEELIRVRRRLEKKHNLTLVKVLTDELEEREGLEIKARPSWMNQAYGQ